MLFLQSKITHPDPAAFVRGVVAISQSLGINPDWLMGVMWIEARMKASIVNPKSGASGLIQFMPATAREMGTTIEAIRKMNAIQQLPYIEKYFKKRFAERKAKPTGIQDLYLLTLYPVAYGKPDTYVLFRKGTKAYEQNPIDFNTSDSGVTVADVKEFIRRQLSPFDGFEDVDWSGLGRSAALGLGSIVAVASLFFLADYAVRGKSSFVHQYTKS